MKFSIVILIRTLRPLLLTVGIAGWCLFRCGHCYYSYDYLLVSTSLHTSSTTINSSNTSFTLLNLILHYLIELQDIVLILLTMFLPLGDGDETSSLLLRAQRMIQHVSFYCFHVFWILVEDFLGMVIFLSLWRFVYCCYHYTYLEMKDYFIETLFELLIRYNIPPQLATTLQKEYQTTTSRDETPSETTMAVTNKKLKKQITYKLPFHGKSHNEILEEIQQAAANENQLWMDGKVSGTVYPSHHLTLHDKKDTKNNNNTAIGSRAARIPTRNHGAITAAPFVEAAVSTTEKDASHNTNNHTPTNPPTATTHRHTNLMNAVYNLYSWSNPLHYGFWPKLNQCESEIISMTGYLLHAPVEDTTLIPYGTLSSGGTESILLSIHAHVVYYGKLRGITKPEIICGTTAHASVDKACELYNIRKVMINCNEFEDDTNNDEMEDDTEDYSYTTTTTTTTTTATTAHAKKRQKTMLLLPKNPNLKKKSYKLSPKKVLQHITSNTIMIYASAPSYPQGVIDPIEKLSDIAYQYNIGLHVDACLGGFVLPFVDNDDDDKEDNSNNTNDKDSDGTNKDSNNPKKYIPKFDFRCKGVTAMSVDTHKYGFASKGTSVVLYRFKELRHAQYFCYGKWTGGLYATPTIAGSRPGGLVMSAWAALVSTGISGYKHHVSQIVTASRTIAKEISKIPGILLMTDYPTMIVCFSYDKDHTYSSVDDHDDDNRLTNIYKICDEMNKKGWKLNSLQNPPAIHICMTMNIVPKVDEFITDLKDCVSTLQKELEEEEEEEEYRQDEEVDKAQSSSSLFNVSSTKIGQILSKKRKRKKKSSGESAGIYGATGTLPDGPVKYLLQLYIDQTLTP